MTVDLPEPFGPRKPKIDPLADGKGNVIDRGEMCRSVSSALRTRSSRSLILSSVSDLLVVHSLVDLGSFYIRKINISRHPGAQPVIVARQPNLDAEYLLEFDLTRFCTLRGVNSAWRLTCSTVPSKSFRERVNPDAHWIAHLD